MANTTAHKLGSAKVELTGADITDDVLQNLLQLFKYKLPQSNIYVLAKYSMVLVALY